METITENTTRHNLEINGPWGTFPVAITAMPQLHPNGYHSYATAPASLAEGTPRTGGTERVSEPEYLCCESLS